MAMNRFFLKKHKLKTLVLLSFISCSVNAITLSLPEQGNVIGQLKKVAVHSGETLADVGRRFDIGFLQMQEANPDVKTTSSLRSGMEVIIPAQFILPDVERAGIVINLAEQRMYFYPAEKHSIVTEPVGIGRQGQWKTPLGITKVTKKQTDPVWHPTANVRIEAAKNGTPIPWQFKAGPNNPLGKHVLRLGWSTYLIHGTNHPETVGGRVSAGCIRMLPEGIANLYPQVEVGTKVTVVNQPYKIGWLDNKLYFEAHKPFEQSKEKVKEAMLDIVNLISNEISDKEAWVNWQLVRKYAKENQGFPLIIGSKIISPSLN